MKSLAVLTLALILSACSGRFDYTPPTSAAPTQNSITIAKPKDEVWKQLIAGLSSKFFVVNNMDKESGFINVSYSGDPETYVDCGTIDSFVSNLRGDRRYVFPASRGDYSYEAMINRHLFFIRRHMVLDGRINVLVQPIDGSHTSVIVHTRYVLTKTITAQGPDRIPVTQTGTINFDSGQSASFPVNAGQLTNTCESNGRLEADVLSITGG